MNEESNLTLDPVNVPMVRVLDENGKEVLQGYYIYHIKRQLYPFGDTLEEEDVQHIVAVEGPADWGLPKKLELKLITPPHRIEIIGD